MRNPIRKPSEFAVIMNLHKIAITRQCDLDKIAEQDYFNEDDPCHIYFIGSMPKVVIDPKSFRVNEENVEFDLKIQNKDKFETVTVTNPKNGLEDMRIVSEFPFSEFELRVGEEGVKHHAGAFLMTYNYRKRINKYMNFEVLYIGQSYGEDGNRTAIERLGSHSTLQGIYAESITRNPDKEIWLGLASFEQINLTMMDGQSDFSESELNNDFDRMVSTFNGLNAGGISEKQKINFTEAALIKYFKPPYNVMFKDTFPNPSHRSYSECYDLDVNAVAIELNTAEKMGLYFFSENVSASYRHQHTFPIHSPEERKSMFDMDWLEKK